MTPEEHKRLHDEGIAHDHAHEHSHDHEHDYGHEHSHDHDHDHVHGHTHTHANKRAVTNRLAKAIGHLESVKRMVEDDRDCSEVLIQLAAVISAINNTGKVILHEHIEHCIVDAVREGDATAVEDLQKAIDKFL